MRRDAALRIPIEGQARERIAAWLAFRVFSLV